VLALVTVSNVNDNVPRRDRGRDRNNLGDFMLIDRNLVRQRNKVNLTDMLAKVEKTTYHDMGDGHTTFCCLHMKSGYKVWGQSACVDSKNFNQAMGEQIAYKDAVDKLWPLEGYLLAEELYNAKTLL